VAAVPEAQFERMVASWRERIAAENERVTIDLLRASHKARRRAEREQKLAECAITLPGKRHGVIYADPEWRFEPRSRETGMDRAADNHYPTSSTDDIAARDVLRSRATIACCSCSRRSRCCWTPCA
jgi:hypothetical protein